MKYRIVQMIGNAVSVTEFDAATPDEAISVAATKGYAFTYFNSNRAQRDELIGQPKFKGVLGPMWDGDAIRYEDQAAYREFSQ
ncbi:MAG: hypothetical protein IPG54_01740 [Sphingomonadales bacterium]|jgi:hypothetical protein|nr:hypothetical protein [Sphingomonadales bacterium]MBK9003554.1 hypothetical protein [Sphingomonadales bacterium]MBK9268751.1 hypothetical protein [Sphingomonadales bacterium]